jgi:hypothetical protein
MFSLTTKRNEFMLANEITIYKTLKFKLNISIFKRDQPQFQ